MVSCMQVSIDFTPSFLCVARDEPRLLYQAQCKVHSSHRSHRIGLFPQYTVYDSEGLALPNKKSREFLLPNN